MTNELLSAIQVFKRPEFGEIRLLEIDGKPYAVGVDVARALEYANPSKAVLDHCKGISKLGIPSYNQHGAEVMQETNCIPEGDIYRLIIKAADQSRNPDIKAKAEKFESWIFDEILPSIHRHGMYATPDAVEQMLSDPDTMIKTLLALKAERNKNLELQAVNSELTVQKQIMAPKAEYFDELVSRNLLTSIRETAKEFGVKEREFVRFLVDHKYLYRDKKGKLQPYAGKNDGLFEVKECYNEKTEWSGTQTMVTPKGRETFRLLMEGLAG